MIRQVNLFPFLPVHEVNFYVAISIRKESNLPTIGNPDRLRVFSRMFSEIAEVLASSLNDSHQVEFRVSVSIGLECEERRQPCLRVSIKQEGYAAKQENANCYEVSEFLSNGHFESPSLLLPSFRGLMNVDLNH